MTARTESQTSVLQPTSKVATPYLTAREAAAYLKIAYGTFRNLATQIKRNRLGRYNLSDLDHFAKTRRK